MTKRKQAKDVVGNVRINFVVRIEPKSGSKDASALECFPGIIGELVEKNIDKMLEEHGIDFVKIGHTTINVVL